MSVKNRIRELNTKLAATLTEKGVEASAEETTTELVDKVGGLSGKDGWIYEWARQCTKTGTMSNAEIYEIGDLTFENAIDVGEGLFQSNPYITKVGNITAPIEESRYGARYMFNICPNLISVGNITLNSSSNTAQIASLFLSCSKLQTVGFIEAPLYGTAQSIFSNCVELTVFGGFKNSPMIVNYQQAFLNCKKLREITLPIDFTSCIYASEMLRGCESLESLFFVKETLKISLALNSSPNLSDASIQSIIDGLADLTGQTAQTLTLHKDVKAKLTEEQIATITNKNWTLA